MRLIIKKRFELSPEGIDSAIDELGGLLDKTNGMRKEIIKLRLGIETVLLTWMEQAEAHPHFELFVRNKQHGYSVQVRLAGKRMNPLADADEPELDELNIYFAKVRKELSYSYVGGKNRVTGVIERKKSGSFVPMLLASALGIVSGLLIRQLLPDTYGTVLTQWVQPLYSAFLGFLNAFAIPMVFLSLLCGIINVGSGSQFSLIAKGLLARFAVFLVATAVGSTLLCTALIGNFSLRGSGSVHVNSILTLLLDFVPSNIFGAFVDNNTVQVVIIAMLLGLMVLKNRETSTALVAALNGLNNAVFDILSVICSFLPLLIFLGMCKLALSDSFSNITGILAIMLLFCTIAALVVLVHIVYLALCLKRRPWPFIKAMMPGTLTALLTASSSASYQPSATACEKELGIDSGIVRFGLPLGSILYKLGSCINLSVCMCWCASEYGLGGSAFEILMIILLSILFTVAAPPVPGGSILSFALAFDYVGIPEEALILAISAYVFLTFLTTAIMQLCAQIQLLTYASRLSMVDVSALAWGKKAKALGE